MALVGPSPSISPTTSELHIHNDHALGRFLLCSPTRYAIYTFRHMMRASTPGAFIKTFVMRVRTHEEIDANGLPIEVASGHT